MDTCVCLSIVFHFPGVGSLLQQTKQGNDSAFLSWSLGLLKSFKDPVTVLIGCPNSLSSVQQRSVAALFPAPSKRSSSSPSRPTKEARFSRMRSRSFGHSLEVMAAGNGWNIGQLINEELCLPIRLSPRRGSLAQWLLLWKCRNKLPVRFSVHVPITYVKHPEIRELLCLRL